MSKKLEPNEVLEMAENAVKALGIKYKTLVMTDVVPGDTGRIKVYTDGKYFGVYDTVRKTFVD